MLKTLERERAKIYLTKIDQSAALSNGVTSAFKKCHAQAPEIIKFTRFSLQKYRNKVIFPVKYSALFSFVPSKTTQKSFRASSKHSL